MRKVTWIPLFILISSILTSCNLIEENKKVPIELVAFNSLTEEEQDLIKVSPKDSSVEKVQVDDVIKKFVDDHYEKDQVYEVTFNYTETLSTGNLVVYVDLDEVSVIGKGYKSKGISD